MLTKIRIGLICLNLLLIFANCVKNIEFLSPEADTNNIVVSGRFTNLEETHILRLTRPGNYNKQGGFETISGASVTLSDDAGNKWAYLENDRPDTVHHYYLENVKGLPGRSYSLEVKLANGEIYRTLPQKMLQPIPMDSAWLQGEKFKFVRSNGVVAEEPYVNIYVSAKAPANGSGGYLRWDMFSVHIFNEIEKIYNPVDKTQRQCFLTSYFNVQNVPTFDLSELQAGKPLVKNIGKKSIDNLLEWRSCFNIYQITTSKETYEYWQKVTQLLDQTGTILDPPPAPIAGNLLRDGDPARPTLGLFEVSSASIKRVFMANGELGVDYQYFPAYCQYEFFSGKWPPVNYSECDDCRIIKNGTMKVPNYW